MFTKDQIKEWLQLNSTGDNNQNTDYFHSTSLKFKLVEAKILVDRWENLASDFVFHSSKKDFVREKLGNQLEIGKIDSIWGVNIHYSDDCPVDKGIAVDASDRAHTENARHLTVFPV